MLSRLPIILLAITTLSAAGVLAYQFRSAAVKSPWQGGQWGFSSPSPNPNDTPPPENARVSAVIDGLTIKLETGHIIRYLGVRVPNVRAQVECFGREVISANEAIIGQEVRLEEDSVLARAKDGAWVRYVYLQQVDKEEEPSELPPSKGGEGGVASPSPNNESVEPSPPFDSDKEIFINERMLEGGFGFPLLSEEARYSERMLAAARYAKATQKGLWGKCEVEQPKQGLFVTKPLTKDEDCIIKGKSSSLPLNKGEPEGVNNETPLRPSGYEGQAMEQFNNKKYYYPPTCTLYSKIIPLQSEGGSWLCGEQDAKDKGFKLAPGCQP